MLASNWKNALYIFRTGKKKSTATTMLKRWRSAGCVAGTRTNRLPRGYAIRRHDMSCTMGSTGELCRNAGDVEWLSYLDLVDTGADSVGQRQEKRVHVQPTTLNLVEVGLDEGVDDVLEDERGGYSPTTPIRAGEQTRTDLTGQKVNSLLLGKTPSNFGRFSGLYYCRDRRGPWSSRLERGQTCLPLLLFFNPHCLVLHVLTLRVSPIISAKIGISNNFRSGLNWMWRDKG